MFSGSSESIYSLIFHYYKDEEIPNDIHRFYEGYAILENHPLLGKLKGDIEMKATHLSGKNGYACVTSSGFIFANYQANLSPKEWAYVFAHCLLHLALGHFDKDHIPQGRSLLFQRIN